MRHPKDYSALLELLGPEEFERRVCSLHMARERCRERPEPIGGGFGPGQGSRHINHSPWYDQHLAPAAVAGQIADEVLRIMEGAG